MPGKGNKNLKKSNWLSIPEIIVFPGRHFIVCFRVVYLAKQFTWGMEKI